MRVLGIVSDSYYVLKVHGVLDIYVSPSPNRLSQSYNTRKGNGGVLSLYTER